MQRFVFEIGTEELPAMAVRHAADELRSKLEDGLKAADLPFAHVERLGTPRRLAVVMDVALSTAATAKVILGPPVRVAFDGSGAATRATLAFAERIGCDASKLERVTTEKGEYVGARVEIAARSAADCILPVLRGALNLTFAKSMRWGNTERTFARPVRWICALLGDTVLPLQFGDVVSGRVTFGHRFAHPGPIELRHAEEYVERLRAASVIARIEERSALIQDLLREAVDSVGAEPLSDPKLFEEVCFLVENPSTIVGSIPTDFLTLPAEVLIQEMRTHQRYFAVRDATGSLLPHFVAVSNTQVRDTEVSRTGYERVLRARLADARFFFDEDRKQSLESRVSRLGQVVFHGRSGTVLQKVERLEQLSAFIANETGHGELTSSLMRAARLSKSDLITYMVKEFPELQGVVGRHYATLDGEPVQIANALEDYYRPRSADDSPPVHAIGALLGTADRIDTLCALFLAGEEPTSTTDPFGLRRACIGVITIAEAHGFSYSLERLVRHALTLIHGTLALSSGSKFDDTVRALLAFVHGRMRALWTESYRTDVVDAVLAAGADDIANTSKRLAALSKLLQNSQFKVVTGVVKRVVNIVRKEGASIPEGLPDRALCTEGVEQELLAKLQELTTVLDGALQKGDYEQAFLSVGSLELPLARFFDDVLVLADDVAIRHNRLRLMRAIAKLAAPLADFSKLAT